MTGTWTAPDVERPEPDRTLGERDSLEAWLDWHRATLLRKCAGLTAEQLVERSVPPSALSLLGIVRHMTEVERGWFRMHVAGEQLSFPYDPDQTGADFDDTDPARAEHDLAAFREEVDLARAAARTRELDEVVTGVWHPGRRMSVRWIHEHMVEEYARHNGHADLLREAVDGATGY